MPTKGTFFGTPKFICCRFLPQRTRQQHERCSNTATTHFRPLGKKRARQVIEAQCTRGNQRIRAKRSRRQLPLLRWEKCFLFGTAKWKFILPPILHTAFGSTGKQPEMTTFCSTLGLRLSWKRPGSGR